MKPACPVFNRVWRLLSTVVPATRAEVDWMIKRHYLGKWPGVCVCVLALKKQSEFLGVIVFALPPKETSKRYAGETWELARLWLSDSVPQNGETWVISQALKHIKKNFRKVQVIVSYADPSAAHEGTIYRAANFERDGMTDEGRKTPRFDYADALTGKKYSRRGHVPLGTEIVRVPRISKHRYIYRLRQHAL